MFEVIFIDDGSRDRSVELIQEQNLEGCHSRIIEFSKNYGSHAALRAGIEHAKGQYMTFLYADLQDPPALVVQMYEECLKGNDIVWAVRRSVASGFSERLFSRFYAFMMQRFAIGSFPERGFDVVMFNQKVAQEINRNVESNSSIFLQILSVGFAQSEILYDKVARKKGISKWTFSAKVKHFIDSFIAFSYLPIRFVSIAGIAMLLVGVIWTCYLVGYKLFIGNMESGWPTLMSVLLIGFGVTNVSLGIIAEYLWRTLDVSRKRPVYIIKEIIEINK